MKRNPLDALDPYFGMMFDQSEYFNSDREVRRDWCSGIWKSETNLNHQIFERTPEQIRISLLSDPDKIKYIYEKDPKRKFLLEEFKFPKDYRDQYKQKHIPELRHYKGRAKTIASFLRGR